MTCKKENLNTICILRIQSYYKSWKLKSLIKIVSSALKGDEILWPPGPAISISSSYSPSNPFASQHLFLPTAHSATFQSELSVITLVVKRKSSLHLTH